MMVASAAEDSDQGAAPDAAAQGIDLVAPDVVRFVLLAIFDVESIEKRSVMVEDHYSSFLLYDLIVLFDSKELDSVECGG